MNTNRIDTSTLAVVLTGMQGCKTIAYADSPNFVSLVHSAPIEDELQDSIQEWAEDLYGGSVDDMYPVVQPSAAERKTFVDRVLSIVDNSLSLQS